MGDGERVGKVYIPNRKMNSFMIKKNVLEELFGALKFSKSTKEIVEEARKETEGDF